MYVGSATAPLTPLPAEQVAQNPAQLDKAQGVYRLAAMNLRDAMVGLEARRARGASSNEIAQQEALVRRQQEQLEAADQGIRRIVPSAVATPVGRPAAPAAAAAPVPTAPDTVPAIMPPNALGAAPTRVTPEMQARFNAQTAGIWATELRTVARADEELSAIDRGLKQQGLSVENRAYLTRLRAETAAARELLAQRGAAPAAAAPVAAATAAEAAPAEPAPGPVATVLQPAAGVTTPEKDILPSQVYAVDPSRITFDQRFLNQSYEQQRQITTDDAVSTLTNLDMTYNAERETLVAQYNAQIQAGRSPAAMTTRSQIIKLDEDYRTARTRTETGARSELLEQDRKYELGRLSLASVAAAAQLEYQREPAGAAQLLSYIFQQPMKLQMRSDGNIDMLLPQRDGAFAVRGTFSQAQVIDMLRSAADQVYRAAKAETQREVAVKVTEQEAQMIRELAKAQVETQGRLQEITLRGQQFEAQADGTGRMILYTPDRTRAYVLVDREMTVNGRPVTTPVLQPIPVPR
jgi:hypothetical protein